MTKTFMRSKSFNQKAIGIGPPRSLSFGSPRVSGYSGLSRKLNIVIIISLMLSFSIALASSYFFVLLHMPWTFHGFDGLSSNDSMQGCDFFDGDWVVDDNYPLYNASECPFVEQGFDCLRNGRNDVDYLKWRWRPKNCNIPRFRVSYILDKFRSKRIVFVGDSMSRTQWESLICFLMTGVEDKKTVYEVNSNKITKRIRYLSVHFISYNFTVEFFRSVFLVEHGGMPKHAPKRVKSTLKLDKMDDISKEWIDSDVLIFNTGQWWVPWKLFETGCYFQIGNVVKLGIPIHSAFRLALQTWASWVQENIDAQRTNVFFRTYEPSHWSDKPPRICNVTRHPTSGQNMSGVSSFSDIAMEVVRRLDVPIRVLQVTYMSGFRSDAHVGEWNDEPSTPDCSHWCLPGVPDIWNEILLASLFLNGSSNLGQL